MAEYDEHSFNTGDGVCIITPERIILERHGFQRALSSLVYGNSINRAATIYALIAGVAFGIGAWAFMQGSYFLGVLLYLLGLYFFRNVIMCRNTSMANVIERSSIQSVEVHKPHPPFTRGYFIVWFLDGGRRQRRFIMLPGFLSSGSKEFDKALAAMQKTSVIKIQE